MKKVWILILAVFAFGCGGPSEQAGSAAADEAAPPHPGQQIYQQYCFSCHYRGVGGAPMVGDAEAWAPLIEKGPDVLLQSTIAGIPPDSPSQRMPARGLCSDCSDQQLAEVIDYMMQNSQ